RLAKIAEGQPRLAGALDRGEEVLRRHGGAANCGLRLDASRFGRLHASGFRLGGGPVVARGEGGRLAEERLELGTALDERHRLTELRREDLDVFSGEVGGT